MTFVDLVHIFAETNPTDCSLFQVKEEDGTTVTYFGTKDSEGLPVAMGAIEAICKEYNISVNAEVSLEVPGGAEGVMDIRSVWCSDLDLVTFVLTHSAIPSTPGCRGRVR